MNLLGDRSKKIPKNLLILIVKNGFLNFIVKPLFDVFEIYHEKNALIINLHYYISMKIFK